MIKIQILRSRSRGGKWRWRTKSKGRVGVWSEAYHNRADLDASIAAHRRELAAAEIEEI